MSLLWHPIFVLTGITEYFQIPKIDPKNLFWKMLGGRSLHLPGYVLIETWANRSLLGSLLWQGCLVPPAPNRSLPFALVCAKLWALLLKDNPVKTPPPGVRSLHNIEGDNVGDTSCTIYQLGQNFVHQDVRKKNMFISGIFNTHTHTPFFSVCPVPFFF